MAPLRIVRAPLCLVQAPLWSRDCAPVASEIAHLSSMAPLWLKKAGVPLTSHGAHPAIDVAH